MTPPAVIPFVKASACGNDFLIVEGIEIADMPEISQRMCDRRTGVGADGVEWLFKDKDADIGARLFNADGSEAEISGNGTRCVAAYLCSKDDKKKKIVIRTGAGAKTCTLVSHSHRQYEFEIAMGEPEIGEQISIPIACGFSKGLRVSMGNPHFVSIAKDFPERWQAIGAEIQRNPIFKNGINVEFVVIENESNIGVRFYERGVGETQSSGTGSCAAAVAAIASGNARSPVRVHAAGGMQTVRWDKEVFLTGPASLLFRGEFFV